jgi:hypothetical protein
MERGEDDGGSDEEEGEDYDDEESVSIKLTFNFCQTASKLHCRRRGGRE